MYLSDANNFQIGELEFEKALKRAEAFRVLSLRGSEPLLLTGETRK